MWGEGCIWGRDATGGAVDGGGATFGPPCGSALCGNVGVLCGYIGRRNLCGEDGVSLRESGASRLLGRAIGEGSTAGGAFVVAEDGREDDGSGGRPRGGGCIRISLSNPGHS